MLKDSCSVQDGSEILGAHCERDASENVILALKKGQYHVLNTTSQNIVVTQTVLVLGRWCIVVGWVVVGWRRVVVVRCGDLKELFIL